MSLFKKKTNLFYAASEIAAFVGIIWAAFNFLDEKAERLSVLFLFVLWIIVAKRIHHLKTKENIQLKELANNKTNMLKGLIDSIPDLIYFKDHNSAYLGCNRAVEELLDKNEADIIGKTAYDFFPKNIADSMIENDKIMLQNGEKTINKEWHTYPNGREMLVETLKSTLYDSDGKIIGILGVGRDITQRNTLELKLIEKQSQLNAILNNIPALAWMKDKDGKFLAVNKPFADACGLNNENIIGKTDAELWPGDLAAKYTADDLEIINSGDQKELLEQIDTTEGRRWFTTFKTPVKIHSGEIIGTVGLSNDVTERVIFEKQLLYKDKLLTAVADSINELMKNPNLDSAILKTFNMIGNTIDVDRIYLFENSYNKEQNSQVTSQKYEWTSDTASAQIDNSELQNIPFEALSGFIDTLAKNQPITGLAEKFEPNIRKILESQNIISIMAFPIFIEDYFYGFVGFDECKTTREWSKPEQAILLSFAASLAAVIERNQKKEQEKNKLKRELEIALKHANLGLWYWNIQTNQVDFSDSLVEMLGYKPEEVESDLSSWINWLAEEDKEKAAITIQNYLDGLTEKYELACRVKTKSGEIKWILDQGEIIERDKEGKPLIMTGTHIDITERKRINELLQQKEKMISIGELAAGMAHEINNPIAGIMYGCENIKMRLSPDIAKNLEIAQECAIDINNLLNYFEKRKLLKSLDEISSASEKVSKIVNDMLSFSRKSSAAMQKENLLEILDKSIDLASIDFIQNKNYDFKKIVLIKDYQTVPETTCKKIELEQVFINLLRNASQAMQQDNANPTITLRCYQQNTFVRIEVEDNGQGMDDQTKKRIFEPFYTTKEVGVGTGLGLSISYFIITDTHKGKIAVESELGKGTTFTIDIPIS